jgi:hypothetical protein
LEKEEEERKLIELKKKEEKVYVSKVKKPKNIKNRNKSHNKSSE